MPLVLDGSGGISGVDGTASNPAIEGTDSNTGIFYPAADTVAIGTGGTERVRVVSAGDVGIGTPTPATISNRTVLSINNASNGGALNLLVNGTETLRLLTDNSSLGYVYNIANQPLVFGTNNTERARITSGGDFLVTKTSASATVGDGFWFAPDGQAYATSAYTANTALTWRVYSTGAAAYRFYVGYGGTVYATSTTITAISDQRLKENIQDIDVGLDKIMALKPRKFDWKAGKGKDKKGDRGWIAQEFEQVFPEMIDTWADEPPEGEEPYKAVNADLIPILVKAIQEQQAMIDEMKAEIAALKGNA